MFEKVLADLGITESSVKGAIKGLIDGNPELKAQVREIVGSDEDSDEYVQVGGVDGRPLYAKVGEEF